MAEHFRGLTAATFAPLDDAGQLALQQVPSLVTELIADGVGAVFVSGSTGEGESMSADERRQLASAYVGACRGSVPVIIQVGHNSLPEAQAQAAHAQAIGATAMATAAPCYFKPRSSAALADYLCELSAAAPGLPLYYYHIPGMNHVDLDMLELLQIAAKRLPDFAGLKYSALNPCEMRRCIDFDGGRYDIMFGSDEMLLYGLYSGARSAVGSTYNFAAPLYCSIIDAFDAGDLTRAAALQNRAVEMVEVLLRYPLIPALKATMNLLGRRVGPPRLPFQALSEADCDGLRNALTELGFFSWGRERTAV